MGRQAKPCREHTSWCCSQFWRPSMPWKKCRKSEMTTLPRVSQHPWMRMTALSTTISVRALELVVAPLFFLQVVLSLCRLAEDRMLEMVRRMSSVRVLELVVAPLSCLQVVLSLCRLAEDRMLEMVKKID